MLNHALSYLMMHQDICVFSINSISWSATISSMVNKDLPLGMHDDVTKWKHLPRYWPIVWRIHRWPMNSPHKGQWRGFLMFSLICTQINGWANNREAGGLRSHRAHYDVIVTGQCCGYGWHVEKKALTAMILHYLYFPDYSIFSIRISAQEIWSTNIYTWNICSLRGTKLQGE